MPTKAAKWSNDFMILKNILSLHSRKGWGAFVSLFLAVLMVIPLLNVFTPKEAWFHIPDYAIPLLGKYFCYAIVALAMDMIWGYTGILSLGHGVFFALGGYGAGMYLMRNIGMEGVYKSNLPDFMVFLDWKELPWYWYGFDNFAFAFMMIILLPGLLGLFFGYFAFRSRIKGVYFAIITQAMTFAFMLLFFRNETGFGGNNGLTDFKRLLGFSLQESSTRLGLYIVTVMVLFSIYLLCRFIVKSKLGRVLTAIRDEESRVMFSGYNTINYKLFVWTLSAIIAGVAGALYVPQVGIINPSEMQPSSSIEMVVWVAVGGRGTLVGAALGAILVNVAKSWFTVVMPELWLYFLGFLFVGVTMFLPKGLFGFFSKYSKPARDKEKVDE